MMRYLLLLALLLVAIACGRGPAEEAIKSAEERVSGVGEEVQRYAKDEYEELEAAVARARQEFEKGAYPAVMEALAGISEKVDAATEAAAARQAELKNSWEEIKATLPAQVEKIQARVEELTSSSRLRRRAKISDEVMEAARSGLESARSLWGEASAAFESGAWQPALEKARLAKQKLEELAQDLQTEPAG